MAECYDFAIIGSGFGGSVCAMRLTEKGYSVFVLERGKRFEDHDYPRTNWNIWKYLWMPALRCFGIQQLSLFEGLFVFHGSGVGGGSLVYAAVLIEPDDSFYHAPTWRHLGDWKKRLAPHFKTARRMLGVAKNPRLTPADLALKEIAGELGFGKSFRPTEVGIFFGAEEQEVPDPYFDGKGPARTGCNYCGGCMVGCRYNSKNTLMKNYLYFAEKAGAKIMPEAEVVDIRPLPDGQKDGARYELVYRRSTAFLIKPQRILRARNVILAAGVLGTLKLLLNCRDVNRTLPRLSNRLGEIVRDNSEAFLGSFVRTNLKEDHSKGIAISSVINADKVTQIEPVRFSDGSSLLYWLLSAPTVEGGGGFFTRLWKMMKGALGRPLEFIDMKFIPTWTKRGVALMVMQTEDNLMRLELGRSVYSLFRRSLLARHDPQRTIPVNIPLGQQVTRSFSNKIGGYSIGTIPEGLLNMPMTAHMLGGCLMGRNEAEGVVDENFQVFNYPGMYIVDGSIVPANPGVNPSLTITALAEYAMNRIPKKKKK